MTRIDQEMKLRGLVQTRSQAASLIKAKKVLCNQQLVSKAGLIVNKDDRSALLDEVYVSRGAYKLLQALNEFELEVKDLVCADVGASTGGFTQVLLERGAKKVYAIDVGQGQLHESLRDDLRVENLEKCDVRKIQGLSDLDFLVMDVSFISVEAVWSSVLGLVKDGAMMVILIKPQFEGVIAKGKVSSEQQRQQRLQKVLAYVQDQGAQLHKVSACDVKGKEGNQEYLVLLSKKLKAI